jgi:hypothetical protein
VTVAAASYAAGANRLRIRAEADPAIVGQVENCWLAAKAADCLGRERRCETGKNLIHVPWCKAIPRGEAAGLGSWVGAGAIGNDESRTRRIKRPVNGRGRPTGWLEERLGA